MSEYLVKLGFWAVLPACGDASKDFFGVGTNESTEMA